MIDIEQELKATFLEEARQLLSEAEECFLALEQSPDDARLIDRIFRLAHNLKGSAKGVGFQDVGHFTHELESLILKIKGGSVKVTPAAAGLLLRCSDHLVAMVEGLGRNLEARFDSNGLIHAIQELIDGQAAAKGFQLFDDPEPVGPAPAAAGQPAPMAAPPPVSPAAAPGAPAAVNEAFARDDAGAQPARGAARVAAPAPGAKADESIRVSTARLEKLINFVGEMVILQAVLGEQSSRLGALPLRKTVHQLSKVTKEVQTLSMSLRMVPLKPMIQKLQRILRDSAAQLGKQIDVAVTGDDTEVDKTVMERISDPMVHLVRNSVDHGIEDPASRGRAGKSPTGRIEMRAFHRNGRLVIEVEDDGAGIDPDRIRRSAVAKGLIAGDASLSDKEARDLIFAPGFSTKTEVTDVSGRGVGMDVVRTNISAIGGDVGIESEVGKGTTMRITLPLTLAIVDAFLIDVDGHRFVVPQAQVHETVKFGDADVHTAAGLGEVILLRGETIPLFDLGEMLRVVRRSGRPAERLAIIVRSPQATFAVAVDEIASQLQVVVKQLGLEAQNIDGLSGSTILGDGRPALILELTDLVRRARGLETRRQRAA